MSRRYIYRENKSIIAERGQDGLVGWSKGYAYFTKRPSVWLTNELEDAGYKIILVRPSWKPVPTHRRGKMAHR